MPNIMILYERLLLCNENGGNRSNTSINQRRAFTSSSPQMYHRYRAFLYEPSSNKIIRYNLLRQGKAVPLQAGSDPEGSRKLKFPNYITMAQDGCKVVSLTHRPPLPPRKYSWYSFLLEAELIPGPQCDRKDYVNEKFQ